MTCLTFEKSLYKNNISKLVSQSGFRSNDEDCVFGMEEMFPTFLKNKEHDSLFV